MGRSAVRSTGTLIETLTETMMNEIMHLEYSYLQTPDYDSKPWHMACMIYDLDKKYPGSNWTADYSSHFDMSILEEIHGWSIFVWYS